MVALAITITPIILVTSWVAPRSANQPTMHAATR